MKQQDQLRNTLREYYDNQEEPSDEREWERASAYLDAARRRKTIGYSALVIVALVTVLFTLLFYSPKAINNENLFSEQKPVQVSAPERAVFDAPPVKRSETKLQIAPNKDNKHFTSKVASEPEKRVNIPGTTAEFSHKEAREISVTKAIVAEPAVTRQKDAFVEVPVNETTPVEPASANAVFIRKDNNPANTIKPDVPESPFVKEETASLPKDVPASPQNQFLAKEIPLTPAEVSPQIVGNIVLDDNKKEPEAIDSTKLTSPEKAAVFNIADTTHQAPISGDVPTMEPVTVDTMPEKTPLNNLAGEGIFYEAGAAWLFGWKGPGHRDASGLSPVVGIHYMNRLSRRCAFSFGLQYLQVSNLSNSSKTSRVSSYVYGEQSNITVITPSSAYYVVAPLRFHYFLDRKNSFGMGINLAYLLNVDATVTTHDESPGFNGNYKTTKLGGYTQGFSWFDSQVAFCYRRKIGESFGLQAEIFLGLKDVKQDEFFGFKNKERNSGGKLSLIYYAFRKNSR